MIKPSTGRLTLAESYTLVSVTKSDAPSGTSENDWHRYVIVQGCNEILGHRRGSAEAVRAAATTIVSQLNQRRSGKSAKVRTVLEPTQKPQIGP